jgi:hypothetical protein
MGRTSKGILRGRTVDEHIRIDDEGRAVRVIDVHHRFGGFDAGASIAGALTALGVTVLLGGLLGGIGTIGYQLDLERGADELSLAGLIGGLVTLVVAFLVGGWVAGRIARYDGGRNGLMTAVWFIFAAAALAVLGAWLGDKYDVFGSLQVPQWFTDNTTLAATISGAVAAIVMLAAGFAGGLIGARYHARADAYLAAEERDRITGSEQIETFDAAGNRHVSGTGPALRTEPADPEVVRDDEPDRRDPVPTSSPRTARDDDDPRAVRDLGERTHTDRGW